MAKADITFLLALRKLKTQTLRVGNLKFFDTNNIYKMMAIFHFFVITDADIPFLLTLGKLETQTLGVFNNLKFFCMIDI